MKLLDQVFFNQITHLSIEDISGNSFYKNISNFLEIKLIYHYYQYHIRNDTKDLMNMLDSFPEIAVVSSGEFPFVGRFEPFVSNILLEDFFTNPQQVQSKSLVIVKYDRNTNIGTYMFKLFNAVRQNKETRMVILSKSTGSFLSFNNAMNLHVSELSENTFQMKTEKRANHPLIIKEKMKNWPFAVDWVNLPDWPEEESE